MSAKSQPSFRVSLFAYIEQPSGRLFVKSFADYARQHGNWRISLRDYRGDHNAMFLRELETANGIISEMTGLKHLQRLKNMSIPVILIDPFPPNSRSLGRFRTAPAIRINSCEIGRTAAEFLFNRGFRTLVYTGTPNASEWSRNRHRAFTAEAKRLGANPSLCPPEILANHPKLIAFLRRLPKPCAVFAENDVMARHVLHTCQDCGLDVPTEVSVLGVDNDRIICETCQPTLSSIALNAHMIGRNAAEALHAMMEGRPIPSRALNPIPVRIVERNSVGYGLKRHPILEPLLSFIREEATHQTFNVDNVVMRAGFSRRHLENIFRRELGHTIKEEITSVRISQVQRLLIETDLPNAEIAAACGFSCDSYLSDIFHKRCGMTITAYRRQHALM